MVISLLCPADEFLEKNNLTKPEFIRRSFKLMKDELRAKKDLEDK